MHKWVVDRDVGANFDAGGLEGTRIRWSDRNGSSHSRLVGTSVISRSLSING